MTSAIADLRATGRPDPADLLWVGSRPAGRRGRVVVDVIGEVDDYTAPLLAACLRGQSAHSAVRTLVVDLSRVRVLSGACLAVIEEAAEHCAARGARLVLRTGRHEGVGADALPRQAAGSRAQAAGARRPAAAPRRGGSRGPRNVARRSPPVGG